MAYSILPIIDRQTGQVQFKVQGRWCTRYVAEPARLEQLIARCARRPDYEPEAGQLVLVIPSIGEPAGKRIAFSLAKFPGTSALAKMGS